MQKINKKFITYLFPGSFFSEEVTREVKSTASPSSIPSDCYGFYFTEREDVVDGTLTYQGKTEQVGKTYIIGEKIHVDDILDIEENRILRSNITRNSPTKCGIKTRMGNWQFDSPTNEILHPSLFSLDKPAIYKKYK